MFPKTSLFKVYFLLAGIILTAPSTQAQTVDLTSGLVSWYPFSGNTRDAHGNSNGVAANSTLLTEDRFDRSDNAYSFNGGSMGIITQEFDSREFNSISISLWFKAKASDLATHDFLIQGALGVIYVDFLKKGSIVSAFDGTANNNTVADATTTSLTDNQWHHVVGTNDGLNTQVYIDNVLEASYSEYFYKGKSGINIGGNDFIGLIDDIRIYQGAVSVKMVDALYNETVVAGVGEVARGQSAQLVAYPNPVVVGQTINVALPNAKSWTLLNSLGQVVQSGKASACAVCPTIPIQLVAPAAGTYMLVDDLGRVAKVMITKP